jgi:hypothetical protein
MSLFLYPPSALKPCRLIEYALPVTFAPILRTSRVI